MTKFYIIAAILFALLTSSCATMFNGTRYNAIIEVNRPNVEVWYKGQLKGYGGANFKVKRHECDRLAITLKVPGCKEQIERFTTKDWQPMVIIENAPTLMLGLAIDASTGAHVKPDKHDPRITKISRNKYKYTLSYAGCN